MQHVYRQIYYYELDFRDRFKETSIIKITDLFQEIDNLGKAKKHLRYQYFGEKYIYIQSIQLLDSSKQIRGKVRCVRKDVLPEIMDMDLDNIRGIETKENEGVVETTHFVISHVEEKPTLAIEYNQFGAKTQDFLNYLRSIIIARNKDFETIGWRPIVKDELQSYKARIGLLSQLVVKVHKDNIPAIQKMNEKLYSVLKMAQEHFQNQYATLDLKFDYTQKQETEKANNIVMELIDNLVKKKENTALFNTLSIKAQDEEKDNFLNTFDLLVDRVKSKIKVQKKDKYKTVVSEDMFSKIDDQLSKLLKK